MQYVLSSYKHFLKRIVKVVIAVIFFYSGLFFIIRMVNNKIGRRLTIVSYHRVSKDPIDKLDNSLPYMFVTQKSFEAHIKFYKKFYNLISFKELSKFEESGKIPPNSLIITFDDGYEDNYLNAFPVLKKLCAPATFFIVTGFIGSNEIPWWDEIYYRLNIIKNRKTNNKLDDKLENLIDQFEKQTPFLFSKLAQLDSESRTTLIRYLRNKTSTDHEFKESNKYLNKIQIRYMKDHIEYGSHTCSHISLLHSDSKRIEKELQESKIMITELSGSNVNCFAYPTGHYSIRASKFVEKADYKYAVTLEKGINDLNNRLMLKRINIWEGTIQAFDGGFSRAMMGLTLSGKFL